LKVLVIKLGALGDFVLAFQPFAAIRAHHAGARISLLTTAPFAGLARKAPWFDDVLVDARPRWWDLSGLLALRRMLRGGKFDMVYDLQTSGRSSRYFRLMGGNVAWSGVAPGCSHPHANPARDGMHTLDRQRDQLAMAGITEFPPPDLSWLRGAGDPFNLPRPHALLVPGAAPHRPEKRWPAEKFGLVAAALVARGTTPVVVGTRAEAPLAAAILAAAPQARDLTGRTDLLGLAALAGGAALAIGNDTGPMHLAACLGVPGIVLFGGASDPALTAPRRAHVTVLRHRDLRALEAGEVIAALP
jgi:ADP-heptose:LPS heptosyltransferase